MQWLGRMQVRRLPFFAGVHVECKVAGFKTHFYPKQNAGGVFQIDIEDGFRKISVFPVRFKTLINCAQNAGALFAFIDVKLTEKDRRPIQKMCVILNPDAWLVGAAALYAEYGTCLTTKLSSRLTSSKSRK